MRSRRPRHAVTGTAPSAWVRWSTAPLLDENPPTMTKRAPAGTDPRGWEHGLVHQVLASDRRGARGSQRAVGHCLSWTAATFFTSHVSVRSSILTYMRCNYVLCVVHRTSAHPSDVRNTMCHANCSRHCARGRVVHSVIWLSWCSGENWPCHLHDVSQCSCIHRVFHGQGKMTAFTKLR